MKEKETKKSKSPRASQIDRRRALALDKGSASYQERRREIAKAAAEVFNKRGFRGTGIGNVADALGMRRSALYYYIGSKRELFDEVVREEVEANVSMAEAVHASDASAIEKLRTLIIDLMRSTEAHYPLFYIYVRENLSHVESNRTEWSRYVRKLNRRYEAVFIAIIEEGIANGSLRPVGSARTIAYGIIGMMGWTNRWFVPQKSSESGEAIGATFAEMVLGGLKA